MTSPTFPLPSEYNFGKVVARYIEAIADTEYDIDPYPEAVGASGTISFKPRTLNRRVTEDGESVEVIHKTYTYQLNEQGRLVDSEGREGVWLVTDSYTVVVDVKGVSSSPRIIEVTSGHTEDNPLDLIVAGPPEVKPGDVVQVLEVPPPSLPDGALAWGDGGLEWVPLPKGDKGDQGEKGKAGHTPLLTWSGTALAVDGVVGPDLKGPKGDQGDPGMEPAEVQALRDDVEQAVLAREAFEQAIADALDVLIGEV